MSAYLHMTLRLKKRVIFFSQPGIFRSHPLSKNLFLIIRDTYYQSVKKNQNNFNNSYCVLKEIVYFKERLYVFCISVSGLK